MVVSAEALAALYPLEKLLAVHLDLVASQAEMITLKRDDVLFHEGDLDAITYWLHDGDVQGRYENGRSKDISAKSLQARYAVGDLQPRRFTAVVVSPTARLIAIDRRFCEKMVVLDELMRAGKVPEWLRLSGATEWLVKLFRNRAFNRLPSTHLTRLLSAFHDIAVAGNTMVVSEGEVGDAFYVIREGEAVVSKRDYGREVSLAQLHAGDGFGEDALLSGAPRNATVTMLRPSRLLRLMKADFDKLLRSAAAEWVTADQANAMLKQGAQLLDVRSQADFAAGTIAGARNLPLEFLRQNLDKIPRDRRYLVMCNGAERSGSAVFALAKAGIDAHAVFGGIDALKIALENRHG